MLPVAGRRQDCSTKVLRKTSEDILTVSEDSTNEMHTIIIIIIIIIICNLQLKY